MAKRNIPRSCQHCQKAFLTSSDQLAAGKGKFCSRRCANDGFKRLETPVQRFSKLVNKTAACWLWTGATNNKGYGIFNSRYKHHLAHRFSFEIQNGPIPADQLCLHRCDNPLCVNPDHLFLGDQRDNIHDMVTKGRSLTNELHPTHKLTAIDVWDIRTAVAKGAPQRRLAEKYKVSFQLISDIIRGKKRKHV